MAGDVTVAQFPVRDGTDELITMRKQWDVETTTESGHTYRLNHSPPLTEDQARAQATRHRTYGEDSRAVFQWVSDWYPAETDK